MLVKLPSTAGARPPQMNITFSPRESNCFLFPDRNPSPSPTRRSNDPTPTRSQTWSGMSATCAPTGWSGSGRRSRTGHACLGLILRQEKGWPSVIRVSAETGLGLGRSPPAEPKALGTVEPPSCNLGNLYHLLKTSQIPGCLLLIPAKVFVNSALRLDQVEGERPCI